MIEWSSVFETTLPVDVSLLQQKKLTLTEAVDVCKASEATSRRLRSMVGAADEVDALSQSPSTSSRGRRSASKGRGRAARAPSNSRRCSYCDRQHGGQKESCPAYGKTCRTCGKANHFASVCKSKPATQRQDTATGVRGATDVAKRRQGTSILSPQRQRQVGAFHA